MTGRTGAPARDALTEAWCFCLNVERVRPEDRFFDQGGDSIAALRLISRLREHGWSLALKDVYRAPRFEELLGIVRPATARTGPATGNRRLRLSPMQQRTLRLDRVNPHHHNDDAMFALPHDLPADRVVQAIQRVLDHHPVLGSRFELQARPPYQEVSRPARADTATEIVLVRQGDHESVRVIADRAQRSLDLAAGRLTAFRILAHHDRPWALVVVIHHLVCDAVGWGVLISDFRAALEAVRSGRSPSPTPTTDYAVWSTYLCRYAAGPWDPAVVDYWRGRPWSSAESLPLREDRGPRPLSELLSRRSELPLDGLAVGFRRLSASHGSEPIILGALNHALSRVFKVSAPLVDVVVNGRDQFAEGPDVSRTVGWISEIVPTVTCVDGEADPVEVVRTTAAQTAALPGPRISFGALRYLADDVGLRDEFARFPEPRVYLNYRGTAEQVITETEFPELFGYDLGNAQCPDEAQPYVLRIVCDMQGESLIAKWRHCPDAITTETMDGLIGAFEEAVRVVSRHWMPAEADL
ncbi:condensation domain-containing protein [Embleya sp. NPDC001921]